MSKNKPTSAVMVCQLRIMLQIKFNLLSIKNTFITPYSSVEGGATIRISVGRNVKINSDVIIAESPIRRHCHTSIDFRFSDIMLFNFENLNFNNFIIRFFFFILFLIIFFILFQNVNR